MRITPLFLTLGLVFACSIAASDTAQPLSQYRILEWKELVPQSWEPPLVPVAYDRAEKAGVDPGSVVEELTGQLITLPGFMKPLVFKDNWVSEFLLVPYLPHHTKQHAHLHANQMVHVTLLEPLKVDNPLQPIWVVGTMSLKPVFTEEGLAAYSVEDGVATDYEY